MNIEALTEAAIQQEDYYALARIVAAVKNTGDIDAIVAIMGNDRDVMRRTCEALDNIDPKARIRIISRAAGRVDDRLSAGRVIEAMCQRPLDIPDRVLEQIETNAPITTSRNGEASSWACLQSAASAREKADLGFFKDMWAHEVFVRQVTNTTAPDILAGSFAAMPKSKQFALSRLCIHHSAASGNTAGLGRLIAMAKTGTLWDQKFPGSPENLRNVVRLATRSGSAEALDVAIRSHPGAIPAFLGRFGGPGPYAQKSCLLAEAVGPGQVKTAIASIVASGRAEAADHACGDFYTKLIDSSGKRMSSSRAIAEMISAGIPPSPSHIREAVRLNRVAFLDAVEHAVDARPTTEAAARIRSAGIAALSTGQHRLAAKFRALHPPNPPMPAPGHSDSAALGDGHPVREVAWGSGAH